jgi:hypothetical protein
VSSLGAIAALDSQGLLDRFGRRKSGIQRRHGILKDQLNVLPDREQCLPHKMRNLLLVKPDST